MPANRVALGGEGRMAGTVRRLRDGFNKGSRASLADTKWYYILSQLHYACPNDNDYT